MRIIKSVCLLFVIIHFSGCSASLPLSAKAPSAFDVPGNELRNVAVNFNDLPPPASITTIAVSFNDQSGQKGDGVSELSTVISQGLASTLIQVAQESGYFAIVERDNFKQLMIEREIIAKYMDKSPPELLPAKFHVNGGVISYQRNVRSGGLGAGYEGVGADATVREDSLTVSLRFVSPKNGLILHSEATSKTVFSFEIHANLFKFLEWKKLAEGEGGIVNSELVQRCVYEAMKQCFKDAIIEMIAKGHLELKKPDDMVKIEAMRKKA